MRLQSGEEGALIVEGRILGQPFEPRAVLPNRIEIGTSSLRCERSIVRPDENQAL
jgi:hypothetical protein